MNMFSRFVAKGVRSADNDTINRAGHARIEELEAECLSYRDTLERIAAVC